MKQYQIFDIIREKKILQWARHFWRKGGTLVWMVKCEAPQGKRLLRRLRLKWENQVREDVQMVDPNADWHASVMDRGKWHDLCLTV